MRGRLVLAGLLVATLVTGCSITGGDENRAQIEDKNRAEVAVNTAAPLAIKIPSLKVDYEVEEGQDFIPLGIQGKRGVPVTTKAGEIETPDVKSPMTPGWFCPLRPADKVDAPIPCGAPVPGDVGPAVVVGHIDGNHKNGIFKNLAKLKKGAIVKIDRTDGLTAEFKITKVQTIDKDAFPTDAVYGNTDNAQIRLISCGGRLDPEYNKGVEHHRYIDQIIAYGDLVSVKPTA